MSNTTRRPLPPLSLSSMELFLLSADDALVDYLISFWSEDVIARMHSVSQNVLIAIKSYVAKTWNVNSFFEDWFADEAVSSVADKMEKCGALAAGSAVLQFMSRLPPYPGSDLDIFVPWWGLLEFGRFLRHSGYKYHPREGSCHLLFDIAALTLPDRFARRRSARGFANNFGFQCSYEVFDFRASSNTEPWWEDDRHIQLIAVFGDPLEHVLSFHSTAVMNVLTGKFAASFFPLSTFVNKTTYVARAYNASYGRSGDWKAKYMARGFVVLDRYPDYENFTAYELAGTRYTGDESTWVIRFDELERSLENQDLVRREATSVVPKVTFDIILPTRGPVIDHTFLNIVRPFTVSAMAFASRVGRNEWPYGGTFETIAVFAA